MFLCARIFALLDIPISPISMYNIITMKYHGINEIRTSVDLRISL